MALSQIDPNKLSKESKEFIEKFKKISQTEYNEIAKVVSMTKRPVKTQYLDSIL